MHNAALTFAPFVLAEERSLLPVIGWSLVLIAFCIAGWFLLVHVRKWMKEDIPTGGTGFGLSELRRMHARGELTDEEYERASGKMKAAAKAATANMPDPAGGRRAPSAPPAHPPKQTGP